MDTQFCVGFFDEAIKNYGTPDIFNTDHRSQFTSDVFTGMLASNGITISKIGAGQGVRQHNVVQLCRTFKYWDLSEQGCKCIGE